MAKYLITIADIDLNINTEESREMVDALVRAVDTRIRSIASKSSRLSKSEAAILCAVDYCAESMKNNAKAAESDRAMADLSAELDALKKEFANLSAETEELRRENRVMNDIISKNMSAGLAATAKSMATAGEQLAIETVQPAPEVEPAHLEDAITEDEQDAVPATEVMFDSENAEVEAEQPKKRARRVRAKKATTTSKSKVGDMFDMLTFKDI